MPNNNRGVCGRDEASGTTVGGARLIFSTFIFALTISAVDVACSADRAALSPEGMREIVNPHDAADGQSKCSACHTSKPPELSFDPVTTCVKCHSGNVDSHPISRHPVGRVVRIRVPSFFPLTRDGRMVCYTCHDPHDKARARKLLRVDFKSLCSSCHVGY